MEWFRDRALTLVLMAMFLGFLAAQMVTGGVATTGCEGTRRQRSPWLCR